MAKLTPEGIVPVQLPEYKTKIETNYAGISGASFDLSSNSPDGQLLVMLAQGYYELDQKQVQTFQARDPRLAQDSALDDIAAHQRLTRYKDIKSVMELPCYGSGMLTQGNQIRDMKSDLIWSLLDDIALPGTGRFECIEPGANYPSDDLSIATPQANWSGIDVPSNTAPGRLTETDTELRIRRDNRVAGPSQAMEDSIRAAIRNVEGVIDSQCYFNWTQTTDVHGQPKKTMRAVVLGGLTEDICKAIYLAQPPLMETVGAKSYTVTTELNPYGREISHDVSNDINILVKLDIEGVEYLDDPTKAAIKSNIVKYANGSLDEIAGYNFHHAGYLIGMDINGGSLYMPVNATIGSQAASSDSINIRDITVARESETPSYDYKAVVGQAEKGVIIEDNIEFVGLT
ncbi:hypothetical protein [Vibrio lentus]|uniref:hypothetical protein n=2 Tax=Vibrio lentus TaxID=136468 RepID=UPI001D058ECB|nr:hypothetical protein [Vibrio lentus]MCB5464549.1 hypothetical protein [Vibrio lentus]MCC4849630.1 hypothetical protein [Vibrio lentus]